MEQTDKLKLNLPSGEDLVNVEDLNANFRTLDGADVSRTLHWEEYQALSEEEKNHGSYYIDDVDTTDGGYKPKYELMEMGMIPQASVGANSHIHQTFTLNKVYSFDKAYVIVSPISYTNTAYASACCHWGSDTETSASLTESDKLTVYVTNHHTASQVIGGTYAIYERVE